MNQNPNAGKPRFSGTAEIYAQKYKNLECAGFEISNGEPRRLPQTLPVPITEYSNHRYSNAFGIHPNVKTALKDHLISFATRTLVKRNLATVTKVDGRTDISSTHGPLLSYSAANVSQVFYGKGSPDMVREAADLLSLCRTVAVDLDKETEIRLNYTLKTGTATTHDVMLESIDEMARKYLGVDCNGFTGHYLSEKYPSLTIHPGDSEAFYAHDKSYRRKSINDIAVDDIVVLRKDRKFHHVAMVSLVLNDGRGIVMAILAEARGNHKGGGPQANIWRITQQRDRQGQPVEGQFDIDTRRETYAVVVDRQRFAKPHSHKRSG